MHVLLSQGEVASIRSVLFLIVQQSQPYNSVHSAHNISSHMSHEILSQLSQDQLLDTTPPPPPSVPSPQLDEYKTGTVLGPDLSLDTTFSSMAQPWVQLTPKADMEFPVSSNDRVSPQGITKGGSPSYVSGDSHGRLVYAHVSPLVYNDDSEKKLPPPTVSSSYGHKKASIPPSYSAHEPATTKLHFPASCSDPLLTYHSADSACNAPAPPPISVALQIPPSVSQPLLCSPRQHPPPSSTHSTGHSRSLMSIKPTDWESEVRHTASPQAWIEETESSTRVEAKIRTSITDTVPREKCQTAARIDARLETLVSQSVRPQTLPTPAGLESGSGSMNRVSTAGTVVRMNNKSLPPEVGKNLSSSVDSVTAQTERQKTHANDAQRHLLHHTASEHGGFDVSGLLESLRQLDRTQGQLRATSDRLGLQKPALHSSSSAPSLVQSDAKHSHTLVPESNASSSSSTAACFAEASTPRSSEEGELTVRQEEFSILTPIPEESTLSSSQVNTTLEEGGGEWREEGKEGSSVVRSTGNLESVSFDQPNKYVDRSSTSTTAVAGYSQSSPLIATEDSFKAVPLTANRTAEHGIKAVPVISSLNPSGGLEAASELQIQQSNKNHYHPHHPGEDDNSCIGAASVLPNIQTTRTLPRLHQSNLELPGSAGTTGGRRNNPGTWFALSSHLAQ